MSGCFFTNAVSTVFRGTNTDRVAITIENDAASDVTLVEPLVDDSLVGANNKTLFVGMGLGFGAVVGLCISPLISAAIWMQFSTLITLTIGIAFISAIFCMAMGLAQMQ